MGYASEPQNTGGTPSQRARAGRGRVDSEQRAVTNTAHGLHLFPMAHALPPLDGSLPTLLDYVDFHERQNGQHPWLVFPEAPSSSVVASISFGEMARASHRVAHWLLPSGASEQRETVAIIAHIDEAIYVSLILGLWRAGVVVRYDFTLLVCHSDELLALPDVV